MRFTSEHDLFRTTVRQFFEHEVNPRCDEWERAEQFPAHEVFPRLAEIGLIGLEYALADGGQGADHWYTVILGEELGRIPCGGVPMAIAVHTDMATPSLARFGSRALHASQLAPAPRGRTVGGAPAREPGPRRDLAGISTHPGCAPWER